MDIVDEAGKSDAQRTNLIPSSNNKQSKKPPLVSPECIHQQIQIAESPLRNPGGEEVISLVVYNNKGGEAHNVDFPHGLHAELWVL